MTRFIALPVLVLSSALTLAPALVEAAAIDVRPGTEQNIVNPKSNGTIPVALLGAADFDVNGVVISGLQLSAQGAQTSSSPKGNARSHDVNGDGYMDLVLLFDIQGTGLQDGDTQLCLSGPGFQACDAIQTVPR